MRHHMRPLIVIGFLVFWTKLHSQEPDFIKLIFKDKNNLKMTGAFHQYPLKIFVLAKPTSWNIDRFILNKQSKRHAEAKDPYLFSDTSLNNLFSEKEKDYLAQRSADAAEGNLSTPDKTIHFIRSPKDLPGYFFLMTNPIYTSDSAFAFVDMYVYYKEKINSDPDKSYYGSILFIYKNSHEAGWTLVKKVEEIIF